MTEQKDQKGNIELFTASRLPVFLKSTIYTLLILGIIGAPAYFLDKYLGTFPTIFIIALALAYPTTQFILLKKVKNYAKKQLNNHNG